VFFKKFWGSKNKYIISAGQVLIKKDDDRISRISTSEGIGAAEVVQILKLKRGYVIVSHNPLVLLG